MVGAYISVALHLARCNNDAEYGNLVSALGNDLQHTPGTRNRFRQLKLTHKTQIDETHIIFWLLGLVAFKPAFLL